MARAIGAAAFFVAIGAACSSGPAHTPDGGVIYTSRPPDVIPCTTDTDCCVVTDKCRAAAYVVHAGDTVQMPAPESGCVKCIGPFVQVWCKDGTCQSGYYPGAYQGDHCGTLPPPVASDDSGVPLIGEDGGLETMAAYGCEP
jgi:hypothetical protein